MNETSVADDTALGAPAAAGPKSLPTRPAPAWSAGALAVIDRNFVDRRSTGRVPAFTGVHREPRRGETGIAAWR
jgi:hypothetical protein